MIHYDDLIGIPFVNEGRSLEGFDCYGLAMEVFRRSGIALPDLKVCCRDAERIGKTFKEQRPMWVEHKVGNLPVPCLIGIKFNSVWCNHSGVYIGNGMFIHTREKIGVNVDEIDNPMWSKKIVGYYTPGRV